MTYLPQLYSFSQWDAIYEGLNFLPTDVQLVKDELLLETSGRRYFRFLEGSERKSPRLRAKEGYCIILQYLRRRQYLARTVGSKATSSSTNCYNDSGTNRSTECNWKDQQSRDHFKFLVFDDSLSYPENTEVIFEWTLANNCQLERGLYPRIETGSPISGMASRVASVRQYDRKSEVVWSSHPVSHFESYASCRKRFVIVVGPPCLDNAHKQKQKRQRKMEVEKEDGKEEERKEEEEGKQEERKAKERNEEKWREEVRKEYSCQPSNCIFDAEDLSMKVFRLNHSIGSAGERVNRWSANVAFDPRPFREHVAAVVACADTFNYLPRSGQTGSLLMLDVLRQRVIHARQDRLYHSTNLQYTCTGEQLLTSFSYTDVITSPPLKSLSDEAIGSERRPSHFALLSSDDLTLLRLLSLSPSSTVLTPVLSSVLSRDFRNFAMFLCRSRDSVGTSQASSLDANWPIEVANFCFPAEVSSLFRLCLDVVRKLIQKMEMVDSLPIPKVIASRLKEP